MKRSSAGLRPPVLFVAPVAWDGLRQRHQALAEELARAGYRVAYLNPLIGGGFGLTTTFAILDESPGQGSQPLDHAPGIRVLDLRVPFRAAAWPGLQRIAARLAAGLLGRAGHLTPRHLVWIADPAMAGLVCRPHRGADRHVIDRASPLPPRMAARTAGFAPGTGALVYDRCDRHGTFPGQRPGPWQAYERLLLARAGLVLATTEDLLPAAAATPARRLLVPNAAAPDLLREPIPARPPPPPLRVVSAGAHYEWVDIGWLDRLAGLPGIELHLAGPGRGEAFARLVRRPDVTGHGVLDRAGLRSLLDRCHVGVVPFRDLPLTRAVDPVKAYEYAARGLQVWGTDLPSLRRHPFVDRCLDLDALGPDLVANTIRGWEGRRPPPPPPTWTDRMAGLLPHLEALSA
ncbi:MAG: glycosyltransferase family 1 protein [Candidatus Riflebacteria bacterium]|nr:glycosyltransferase family 1 protein [Candidatus Riflebacteria bacterium]